MDRLGNESEPLNPQRLGFGAMMAFQSLFLVFGLGIGLWGGLFPETAWYSVSSKLASANWFGLGVLASTGLGALVGISIFLAIYIASRWELAWIRDIEDRIGEGFLPLLSKMNRIQLFLLAALAGVGEELCFRWALQGCLESFLLNWFAANVAWLLALAAVSLLFGALHAVTFGYFCLATSIALLLGIAVPAGLGIWGVMVAHGLYDFIAFLWLLGRRKQGTSS